MKIVFAGSPEYAVPSLRALASKYNVAAVITQPDKPMGRKKTLTPTPVKVAAGELGIPVYDFDKIRNHVAEVKALGGDILITCAYGQLLTQDVLDCFEGGVWNLHASLLPLYRGASPIQSAVLGGEEYTGITVMKTELSMDTGDILMVKRCVVENLTAGELSEKLSLLSAEAAVEAVELILKGDVQLLMQDEAKATYCKKIKKEDAKIDFNNSAADICRLIRAMNPEPYAFCNLNGGVLNLLYAEPCEGEGQIGTVICADKRGIVVKCGEGAIKITRLQPSGGKAMSAADFVNGRKIKVGDVLD